jgi:hypothetical protein
MNAKTTAPDTAALTAAAAQLAKLWASEDAVREIAPTLQCSEIDALAALFTAVGKPDVAEAWVTVHTEAEIATEGGCDCTDEDDEA